MHRSPTRSTSRFALWRLVRPPQHPTFSAREVRRRLRLEQDADPRTRAVHLAAAQTAIWSSLVSDKIAVDLGRASTCLPLIVFWYRQGVPTQEIGERVSPFGGAWDAERALDVAAGLIARTLNQPGLLATAA